jgi:hypothetical protein
MARRIITSDQRPGPLPTIQSTEGNITYTMPLDEVQPGLQLRLRCDASGNVYIATTFPIRLEV